MLKETKTATLGPALARNVGFALLDRKLALDVRFSLQQGLKERAVFPRGTTALTIFRQSIATAIGRIHEDGRAPLFIRFLRDGPCISDEKTTLSKHHNRLTDEETTAVIAFIYCHMVNCFKGALAEMLAVAPCLDIVRQLKLENRIPESTRLYIGDAVRTAGVKQKKFYKGADIHILALHNSAPLSQKVSICGVAEVKSYQCRANALSRQLDQHVERAIRGLQIGNISYSPQQISSHQKTAHKVFKIRVCPATWRLPRTFHFEKRKEQTFLNISSIALPNSKYTVNRLNKTEWQVTLGWSQEALAAAAYEMTFWLMEKVGEAIYSKGVPEEWSEMSPAKAGRNAATMMLYYSILRCQTAREQQRAVAIYNTYGFGYALGMNFRNSKGKREMLWPQDLREIIRDGQTKQGCKIF